MVQVLQPQNRKQPSFLQSIAGGLAQGIPGALDSYQKAKQLQGKQKHELDVEELKGNSKKNQIQEAQDFKNNQNRQILRDTEKRNNIAEGELEPYISNPALGIKAAGGKKEKLPALTEKPVPEEISKKIKSIIKENKDAGSDDLRVLMDEAGIPPIYSNPFTENRRRTQEQSEKTTEDKKKALRQETLPLRKELAEKAATASQGIQNKEYLNSIIDTGNVDDPSFAILAQALPFNIGERMLSNETVVYRSGLLDEYKNLRNIFQGATRIKEIELMEKKVADLYLTDDQKRSILRSGINTLKADVIRAEVAEELENEPLGVLQFQQELEKRAKPRLDALFNQILDEQKSIIQNAENRKLAPLDLNDPEDLENFIEEFKTSKVIKNLGGRA